MKEENGKKMNKQKRLYFYCILGCVAVALTFVIIATSVSLTNEKQKEQANNPPAVEQPDDTDTPTQKPIEKPDDTQQDKPVDTKPDGFVLPVTNAEVSNEYGFFYNSTLNNYYEHEGYDFVTAVGEKVYAVEDGTIESVYTSDVLSGTEIVVDHGNGVKTVYRFVAAREGLSAGVKVEKGEEIGFVAEASGNEYKEGAHLLFEVVKNGKTIDPALYLTFEEK
jgi:murein DD-endopeptidase MepM/ murein hydrolase activator NlpD